MKKYSIFHLIDYTPKSKDLSPYSVDINEVKNRVITNIKGEQYVKKTTTSTNNVNAKENSIEMTAEKPIFRYNLEKSIAVACACVLLVSGGIFIVNNQTPLVDIGDTTSITSTYAQISDNIIEGKEFLRWLDFPSTADCIFQTFFDSTSTSMYQSSFALNEDDLQYISDTFYNLTHYMTDVDFTELSPKYEFNISYPNANAPSGQEDILFKIYDTDPYDNIAIQVYYYDDSIYGKREGIPQDDLFSISEEKYQELVSYLEDTLKTDDNLTWDSENKLFNMFSIPSEAILNTWEDTIIDTYTINGDTLIELNNSLHYDTWEQLESNPFDYYNVDVPNLHTHDTINFYGEDSKYSITAYDIENYLIIEGTLDTGEKVSYYFDTKEDNVYNLIQEIINITKDTTTITIQTTPFEVTTIETTTIPITTTAQTTTPETTIQTITTKEIVTSTDTNTQVTTTNTEIITQETIPTEPISNYQEITKCLCDILNIVDNLSCGNVPIDRDKFIEKTVNGRTEIFYKIVYTVPNCQFNNVKDIENILNDNLTQNMISNNYPDILSRYIEYNSELYEYVTDGYSCGFNWINDTPIEISNIIEGSSFTASVKCKNNDEINTIALNIIKEDEHWKIDSYERFR